MTKLLILYSNYSQYNYANGTTLSLNKAYGIINSSKFLEQLMELHDIPVLLKGIDIYSEIGSEIVNFEPTIVLIEGLWLTPIQVQQLLYYFPLVKFIVRVHSNYAFLSLDDIAFKYINGYKDLYNDIWQERITIASNNDKFASYLNEILSIPVEYLPNVYLTDILHNYKPYQTSKISLHIGCFGALRPLKNTLTQAIAAISVANVLNKKLYFHINISPQDGSNSILKNLQNLFDNYNDNYLIFHDWTPHEEFLNTISGMDLNYQVSFSETFNIVCADSIINGIPVIISKAIEWLPNTLQADTQNITEIVSKSLDVLTNYTFGLNSYTEQKNALAYFNRLSANVWLEKVESPYRYDADFILGHSKRSHYKHYYRNPTDDLIT